MKKTRILASLLCIMMVVCSLTVMPVSAAVGDTDSSIADVMGVFSAEAVYEQTMSAGFSSADVATDITTATTYTDDGVQIDANGGVWAIAPTTDFYTDAHALVLKLKVGSGDRLRIYTEAAARTNTGSSTASRTNILLADNRVYYNVSGSLAGYIDGELFNTGNDWFELMVVHKESTVDLYVKNSATGNAWTKLDFTSDLLYQQGHAGTTSNHHFYIAKDSGASENAVSYLKSVAAYQEKTAFASVAEATGWDYAGKKYEQIMSTGFTSSDLASITTATTYTEDGVQLSQAQSTWALAPTADFYTNTHAVVLKLKMGSGDRITVYTEAGARKNTGSSTASRTKLLLADNRIYNTVPKTEAGMINGAVFQPGTDWFELMIVHNDTTADFYVKNAATSNLWKKLDYAVDPQYEQGHAGTAAEHHFYISKNTGAAYAGVTTSLKSISVYQEGEAFESIEAIVESSNIASPYNWNFANSEIAAFERNGGGKITYPAGAENTTEGLDLSETNGTDAWNYYATANWSLLSSGSTSSMIPRALYTKVKGNVNIATVAPNAKNLVTLSSVPGTALASSGGTAHDIIAPDNNWMEYLFVPTTLNGVLTDIYVKSATVTGDKWVHILTTSSTAMANASGMYGISFSGTGVVAGFKAVDYNPALVVAAANTLPADASYLYFGEEFDAEPTYANDASNGVITYSDGYANAPVVGAGNTTSTAPKGNGQINFNGLTIPVGGYAEFKSKSNGSQAFVFYDGTNRMYVGANKDYNTIDQGATSVSGGMYLGDTDNIWRTYRVVRTANGYSVYSNADGESGWRVHSLEGFRANTTEAKVNFQYQASCDGVSDGNGQLDYLRVYGPAPSAPLTLTDGYNTATIAEGATLVYPKSLRAIVTEDAGKLLVVTYKGNDMLKAQIINAADMVNDSILVDARATDATKVKVFLWNDFTSLNELVPAVTLNL